MNGYIFNRFFFFIVRSFYSFYLFVFLLEENANQFILYSTFSFSFSFFNHSMLFKIHTEIAKGITEHSQSFWSQAAVKRKTKTHVTHTCNEGKKPMYSNKLCVCFFFAKFAFIFLWAISNTIHIVIDCFCFPRANLWTAFWLRHVAIFV